MKYVEEIAKYKDRHIEHRKFQMVATSHEFQQRIKVLVNEGMKGKEVEMRSKYVRFTPSLSSKHDITNRLHSAAIL